MPMTAHVVMRQTILPGTYAAHAPPGPASMAFEARKHIATFCAIERDKHAPTIRAVAARKTFFVSKKGAPRDIVMKLKAALGVLHKHMA
jgi:hypothetical protein